MASEVVFDDQEVREFLAEVDDRVKDIQDGKSKYIGILSAIVFRDVIQHFEQEAGPNGGWKPWSNVYKEQLKAEGKSGNRILQFTGRLRNTIKPSSYRTSSDGVVWYNNAKVNGFPYAWAHDEGSGNLPQREFMWLSDKAVEDMSEQTLKFIIEEDL